MIITPQMKKEILEEALEYWINHNYLVAQGIKNSVEWLDEEEEEEIEGEIILLQKNKK
tara:strand:+ start:54 stop:227 length:174 start_codon:yes stop_codon:yes gene_type:complete